MCIRDRDRIEGGVLELALTAHDTIGARKLGHNVDVELPWRTTLYMTGNGATYSDDMSRRLMHISLLSRARAERTSRASQEERSFKHPSLLAHTLARLDRKPREAKAFYGAIALATAGGTVAGTVGAMFVMPLLLVGRRVSKRRRRRGAVASPGPTATA